MDATQIIGACGLAAPVAFLVWNFASGLTRKPEKNEGNDGSALRQEKNVYSLENPEIIVVGSGIVGSALAAVLAEEGRFVTVIERDLSEPDRIVGELLQPGGVRALKALGLEDCLDNIDAQNVKGYIVHDLETDSHVQIPYPTIENEVLEGRSFHHGRFVQNLRKATKSQERVRYIEGNVVRLLEKDDGQIIGVEIKTASDDKVLQLTAPLTIVCDGHFSRFRKSLILENVKVASHFVGLLMDDCSQHLPQHAELVLGNPSPVLIYRVSEEKTRVLVDVQGSLPKNMAEYMTETVAPQLPAHVREPFLRAVESGGRIRSMPSSFLPPGPQYRLGALILGDAYNMRHPLTGGGMSVGLHDVLIWRELLRRIPDCSDLIAIRQAQIEFHRIRKRSHAFVVNVLAQALYALFSASDPYLHSLRRACFSYFRLGGVCVSGPVGLLSVLYPDPAKLIGHFFAVAFYAVYCNFRDIQSIRDIPKAIVHPFGVIFKACQVIFPLIWSEVKTLLW